MNLGGEPSHHQGGIINRDKWERTFVKLLTQHLNIEPEQVRFPWRQYFNQRFTPQQAIAHLQETHRSTPLKQAESID